MKAAALGAVRCQLGLELTLVCGKGLSNAQQEKVRSRRRSCSFNIIQQMALEQKDRVMKIIRWLKGPVVQHTLGNLQGTQRWLVEVGKRRRKG